ncbi:MAG: hypothetical protein KBD66_01755 [Candidatus Doudnabacteria bacterium]|nr:hypothetical protein [Candidatus Doudnabacteria bacterium]
MKRFVMGLGFLITLLAVPTTIFVSPSLGLKGILFGFTLFLLGAALPR